MKVRYIILAAVGAVTVLAIAGGKAKEQEVEAVAVDITPALKAKYPDLEILTGADLRTRFEENEVAAAQGLRKGVIVVDTVEQVTLDFMDQPVVHIGGAQSRGYTAASAASLKEGETVAIRCRKVSEFMGQPVLDHCSPA